MLQRLRIAEYDFFHKTTAFTHTVYFFKIRRIGFRRIGTEPLEDPRPWLAGTQKDRRWTRQFIYIFRARAEGHLSAGND